MKTIAFAVATAAVVAFAVVGISFMPLGQDQSAATPKDVATFQKNN
jgi:hypothetical protein